MGLDRRPAKLDEGGGDLLPGHGKGESLSRPLLIPRKGLHC